MGDVMPGSKKIDDIPNTGILKDLCTSDIVLGNLESPLVSQPASKLNLSKIPLWATAENIDILKQFGFTHLCINNNHTFDLFEKGLSETNKVLNQSDIKGFGLNYDGISQFDIIEKISIRLGIFAVNWVQTQFNGHLFKDLKRIDIGKLKENSDFLVCFLHWGDDHNIFINREQQQMARRLIDQGVDLIIGSHPHVPQGWEVYKGKYIFYSLGNFIFTPKESYDYLPYRVRYDDHRENVLFQRLECKIGLYIKIIFNKNSYNLVEVKPIYRKNTLPAPLPKHFSHFYKDLKKRMNDQVTRSEYELNEAEKKHILISYTLPLIIKHPIYWPILFRRVSFQKLIRFMRPHYRM